MLPRPDEFMVHFTSCYIYMTTIIYPTNQGMNSNLFTLPIYPYKPLMMAEELHLYATQSRPCRLGEI